MTTFNLKWGKKCNITIRLEAEPEILVINTNDYPAPFNLYKRLACFKSRRSEALTVLAFAHVTSEHDFIIQTFVELEYINQLAIIKYFIDTNYIQDKE